MLLAVRGARGYLALTSCDLPHNALVCAALQGCGIGFKLLTSFAKPHTQSFVRRQRGASPLQGTGLEFTDCNYVALRRPHLRAVSTTSFRWPEPAAFPSFFTRRMHSGVHGLKRGSFDSFVTCLPRQEPHLFMHRHEPASVLRNGKGCPGMLYRALMCLESTGGLQRVAVPAS
jgi:hypothetical protein